MSPLETPQKLEKQLFFHCRKRVARAKYPAVSTDRVAKRACMSTQIERYMARSLVRCLTELTYISKFPQYPFKNYPQALRVTNSEEMRDTVLAARKRPRERFAGQATQTNALMNSRLLRQYCELDSVCRNSLRDSVHEMGSLSSRSDKILRVARHHCRPRRQSVHRNTPISTKPSTKTACSTDSSCSKKGVRSLFQEANPCRDHVEPMRMAVSIMH